MDKICQRTGDKLIPISKVCYLTNEERKALDVEAHKGNMPSNPKNVMATPTGDYREPKEGEWYIDSININRLTATRRIANWVGGNYPILKLVKVFITEIYVQELKSY